MNTFVKANALCQTKRMGFIRGLILLWLLLLPFQRAMPSQQADEQAQPYTISLDVDLVVLDVSVVNKRGDSVSGLSRENFKVYEDGRAQEIDFFYSGDVPVTVGLVIDNSGSMRTKRSEAIAAALAFVRSSNPRDEVFVVNFNEDVELGLGSEEPFTNDIHRLRRALFQGVCTGQTALYDALALALDHVKKGTHTKKALLVISDGGDNASQRIKFAELLTSAAQSNATLYAIGVYDSENRDRNPKVLKRLSKVSGGECFFPSSVIEVENICQGIAKDIRTQYTLGYKPTSDKKDGRYRAIQVVVSAPRHERLVARTREGYFAVAAPLPETSNEVLK